VGALPHPIALSPPPSLPAPGCYNPCILLGLLSHSCAPSVATSPNGGVSPIDNRRSIFHVLQVQNTVPGTPEYDEAIDTQQCKRLWL
jgi:hypothetical protein